MKKQLRNAKIFTLIFHGIIVIVAGHGMAILGITDVLFPYLLFQGELQFNSFENLIPWTILSSFLGKVCILISLFRIQSLWKRWLTIFGLVLLLFSYLSIVFSDQISAKSISVLSGVPFLLYFGRVVYLMYQSKTR